MSTIQYIQISKGKIATKDVHWESLLTSLKKGSARMLSKDLDAGYVLVDYDNKILISVQDGFQLECLPKKEFANWYVLEL